MISATLSQAQDRFRDYTRSASFTLQLGIREICMFAEQDIVAGHPAETATLHRLVEKGLVVTAGVKPVLSEAGRLTRQMLVLSRHILPAAVNTSQVDVLRLVHHALDWYNAMHFKDVKIRIIDGEEHLIVRMNDGTGYSEWAIPRSAVKRIG